MKRNWLTGIVSGLGKSKKRNVLKQALKKLFFDSRSFMRKGLPDHNR